MILFVLSLRKFGHKFYAQARPGKASQLVVQLALRNQPILGWMVLYVNCIATIPNLIIKC